MAIHYNPCMKCGHLIILYKADGFCGPSSTWIMQNALDNVDTGMPLAQDCLAPLIHSTTL